jgi:hypothetical protein
LRRMERRNGHGLNSKDIGKLGKEFASALITEERQSHRQEMMRLGSTLQSHRTRVGPKAATTCKNTQCQPHSLRRRLPLIHRPNS